MIICLQKSSCIDVIRQILTEFGEHTIDELVGYFPINDFDYIVTGIKILQNQRVIECITQDGTEYYRLLPSKNRTLERNIPKRSDYQCALRFLRDMINATDKDGKLKNDIPYLCKGSYPATLFFECNGSVYDVYYIPHNRIKPTMAMINRMDNSNDHMDDILDCRIIITDTADDFPSIDIRKVKYKITIENDGSITFAI